jgi:hypothetical protein
MASSRILGHQGETFLNRVMGMPKSDTVSETKLREELVACTRMMVMAELLDYSGHVSARLPGTDRFLIPARDASRAVSGRDPDPCRRLSRAR